MTPSRPRAPSLSFDISPFRILVTSLQSDSFSYRPQEVAEALSTLVDHVDGLTARLHAALSKQIDTEHQLKVARSNLFLSEANMEMMEEAMRRGGEFSHAIISQSHRRSAPAPTKPTPQISTPQTALSSPVVPPPSLERRSTDATFPAPIATTPASGGWFNRQSKRLGLSPAPNEPHPEGYLPAPGEPSSSSLSPNPGISSDKETRPTLGANRSFGSSTPNLGLGLGALGPTAESTITPTLSSLTPNSQIATLRQSLTKERTLLAALRKELAEMKESKAALEAELEGLSQALFEEANKMVADERKMRMGMEDEVKGEKEEKEVLKETMRLVEQDCTRLREIVRSFENERAKEGGVEGETVHLDDLMKSIREEYGTPTPFTPSFPLSVTQATFPPSSPRWTPSTSRTPSFNRRARSPKSPEGDVSPQLTRASSSSSTSSFKSAADGDLNRTVLLSPGADNPWNA